MHQKAFSTRTYSLTCLTSAGILGRIRVQTWMKGPGVHGVRIWLFGIFVMGLTFKMFKFLKRMMELLLVLLATKDAELNPEL